MRKIKKALAIAVCLATVFFLVGCSDDEGNSDINIIISSPSAKATGKPSATSEATSDATKAPSATAKQEDKTSEPIEERTGEPTGDNTSVSTDKPTPKPTNKPTTKPSNPSNDSYPQPVFVTEKAINNLPVFVDNNASAYKIVENHIDIEIAKTFEYNFQNYYTPYKDMYAVGLGTLVYYTNHGFDTKYEKITEQYYKVSYKDEIWYIKADQIMVSGDSLVAKDGNSYKIGEVIYHGSNHDIVVTTYGEFICSDGCQGEIYNAGPVLKTLDDYCKYADASYTDEFTGISYPLCTSKSIYAGKYGTVYALSNGSFEYERIDYGFIVIRNRDYKSVSFDDLDEDTQKFFLENGADKDSWYSWDFNALIYTLEDAKLQADSFETVRGWAAHRATFIG